MQGFLHVCILVIFQTLTYCLLSSWTALLVLACLAFSSVRALCVNTLKSHDTHTYSHMIYVTTYAIVSCPDPTHSWEKQSVHQVKFLVLRPVQPSEITCYPHDTHHKITRSQHAPHATHMIPIIWSHTRSHNIHIRSHDTHHMTPRQNHDTQDHDTHIRSHDTHHMIPIPNHDTQTQITWHPSHDTQAKSWYSHKITIPI